MCTYTAFRHFMKCLTYIRISCNIYKCIPPPYFVSTLFVTSVSVGWRFGLQSTLKAVTGLRRRRVKLHRVVDFTQSCWFRVSAVPSKAWYSSEPERNICELFSLWLWTGLLSGSSFRLLCALYPTSAETWKHGHRTAVTTMGVTWCHCGWIRARW